MGERFKRKNEITYDEYELFDKILIVHINSELDHHNSVFIRESVDKIILEKDVCNVIFDFKNTEFMDSSGIGVIMGRYKIMHELGGGVSIANAGDNIRKIFTFSGLFKIIKQYESIEAALKGINGALTNRKEVKKR